MRYIPPTAASAFCAWLLLTQAGSAFAAGATNCSQGTRVVRCDGTGLAFCRAHFPSPDFNVYSDASTLQNGAGQGPVQDSAERQGACAVFCEMQVTSKANCVDIAFYSCSVGNRCPLVRPDLSWAKGVTVAAGEAERFLSTLLDRPGVTVSPTGRVDAQNYLISRDPTRRRVGADPSLPHFPPSVGIPVGEWPVVP